MKKQPQLNFPQEDTKSKQPIEDDFASSCRPLAELLDEVRDIEGFPVGSDEDILALSDPPYYTACPNPYINDFIARYGKPYDEAGDTYERTPFVADVSAGKNHPIYNAHSYHTKVPHKAIMPFIEHYTEPGDIIFDGFCGTGMTGVAAQMLGRRAVLCDLSPAATFIAYNYNIPVDIEEFGREARRILAEVEEECGWMYDTLHSDGKTTGRINYTVWSDVLLCPYCGSEYIFWETAVDKEAGKVLQEYECPHCEAMVTKRQCERAWDTFYDAAIDQEVAHARQVPVLINYAIGKKRYEKIPEQYDLDLMEKINQMAIPYWFPTNRMPEGYNTKQPERSHGITHVHHFYTRRNLWTISKFYRAKATARILALLTGVTSDISKMARVKVGYYFKGGGGPFIPGLTGTLYIPSLSVEKRVIFALENRLATFTRLVPVFREGFTISTVQSASKLSNINSDCIDYIFTDPPFGSNLMYSELNFLWEAWLKVFTNNRSEAIMNDTQKKGLAEYRDIMTACFKEMYRILKPNRWMTVVFHNSRASVWNVIQEAITRAGFIIAQVTVLDKKQGSFKQVTSPRAVKNDLVINAYKPRKAFTENFLKRAGEGLEREFIREHLDHLPAEVNIERTEQMLYSKMLAHYVQRGYEIRLNASQFYVLLRDNFKLIDGYWFNHSEVAEYEEWKKKHGLDAIEENQSCQQLLFVSDEKSALVWLYHFLNTPRTYNDIYTASRKVLAAVEDEIPELEDLLEQNFILEEGKYRHPYTEEERQMVEAQREKDLLRSFEEILHMARTDSKKIKEVRKEALILGFTRAYQEKRFEDILTVAKRLTRKLIENDAEITDFVEIASLKMGEELQ